MSFPIYLRGYSPAIISRSLGSKFTVHGKNVLTSRATRTGVREDKNTSKFRISPSISSRGSTSLVVGIFFEILGKKLHTTNEIYYSMTSISIVILKGEILAHFHPFFRKRTEPIMSCTVCRKNNVTLYNLQKISNC